MPKNRIFLSHASADAKLVSSFEQLLTRSTGLRSEDIFCTSLEGQGVPKGQNFVEWIRDNLRGSGSVIALISPAYLASPFCMAELGAAWVLSPRRLPILVPPTNFEAMNATLLGIVGVSLDDCTALAQALGELRIALNLAAPQQGLLDRSMTEFQEAWAKLNPPMTSLGHNSKTAPLMSFQQAGALPSDHRFSEDSSFTISDKGSRIRKKPPMKSVAWNERRQELLVEIYRLLQDSALPVYDHWCDEIVGKTNEILIQNGRDAYIEHVNSFLRGNELGVGQLSRLLQSNGIYSDLVKEFSGAPEASNVPLNAQRQFIEKVTRLPERPTQEVLTLVQTEYETLQTAVGTFGEWIRKKIKRAEEIASSFE